MRFTRSRRLDARIPTASMADIAFLLIIFFMVTTVYDVDRTSVALPSSHYRVENEKGAAYVVIHKKDGEIIYKFSAGEKNSGLVSGPDILYLEASRVVDQDPTKEFVIKADSDIRYAVVDEVLDELRKAGVQKLLLLTQQKGGKGPQ